MMEKSLSAYSRQKRDDNNFYTDVSFNFVLKSPFIYVHLDKTEIYITTTSYVPC